MVQITPHGEVQCRIHLGLPLASSDAIPFSPLHALRGQGEVGEGWGEVQCRIHLGLPLPLGEGWGEG
jgi:hypothetical protein